MKGNLGNQDHVRSARYASCQGDPAGIAPHDFADHHSVMTVGCRMKSIKCLGCSVDRRQESEGDLRAVEIVVNCLGDADDIDPSLDEWSSALHRAVTADDDEGIDAVLAKVVHACSRDIAEDRCAIRSEPGAPARRIATIVGPEDRAASGQDARDIAKTQWADAIFDQPLKAILDTEYLDAVLEDGGLRYCTNDRVQTRAVAAASQDSDTVNGFRTHLWAIAVLRDWESFAERPNVAHRIAFCARAYADAMHVASQIAMMKESATLAVGAKVTALKAKGVDVIGFALGEPDFDTPQAIKQRAAEAG